MQRRVVYLGYWLSDSTFPTIVSQLKSAKITHVLLTFIVQPDVTKPLTGEAYMLGAFKQLSSANQKLFTENFKVGVSLGGSNKMPNPFSKTFMVTNTVHPIYYQNPTQYAKDYYNLCSSAGLTSYFDLDIEMIHGDFPQCASFIGQVCQQLKILNPNCEISLSPQMPYFYSSFGNVYNLIYKNYHSFFDFMNLQLYNNGEQNTFEQIFMKSLTTNAPKTSITELIYAGIDPSYLVIGKMVNGTAQTGFVPLTTLATIVKEAFNTPSLSAWTKSGGEMIFYFDTQNLSNTNNTSLLNYFKSL